MNKYLPFALIYFFINSVGLPFGLTYTAILSPFLYAWIVLNRGKEIVLPFFMCMVPFWIAHAIIGVDVKYYLIAIVNYTAVYIFCQAFYTMLKKGADVEYIFKRILLVNSILCFVAIIMFFTPLSNLMWSVQSITTGLDDIRRLKLFTYEPSYYAMLFIPVFFYFLSAILIKKNVMNSWLLLALITVPYILSFSIGVICCILISGIVVLTLHFRKLIAKSRVRTVLLLTGSFFFVFFIGLWLFYPDNTLFFRINNIFTGADTSGNGRTFEAFYLANEMIRLKSFVFGIGAGQIKILGADIVRSFYLYDLDYNNIAIPNAAAETLAIFGYAGLCLRIIFEIVLFVLTKVWTNYYRLFLFSFIFLYQFSGSFITNIAEYVIWIIAFTNVFGMFDIKRRSESRIKSALN